MVVSTLRDRSKTKRQKTSIVDEMSKKSTNLEFPLENDIQLEAHYVHTYIHCLRKRKKNPGTLYNLTFRGQLMRVYV